LEWISHPGTNAKPHGMLFTDKDTVESFAATMQGILKKSKRLIESISTKDVNSFAAIVRKSLKFKRNIYVFNPSFTLQLIDDDLLRDILTQNGVSKEKIELCLSTADKIRKLQAMHQYSYICNLDTLENYVAAKYIDDSNLTEICETQIILSKENRRKIVEYLIASETYKNKRIILTSFENLNPIPDNLSIIVQEDCFLAAWNVKKYRKRLYCLNLDVISGFYRYLDEVKTLIPKVCSNQDWKLAQLKRIRDALPS